MPATRTSKVVAPKRAASDIPIGAPQKTRSRASRTQILDSQPRIPSPRIPSPEDHYSEDEETMILQKELLKLEPAERRKLRDTVNEWQANNPSSTEYTSSSDSLQAWSLQASAVPEPMPHNQYMEPRFVSLALRYPFIHRSFQRYCRK